MPWCMKIIIHCLNPSNMLFQSESCTLATPLYFSVKPLCLSIKALGYTWDKPHFLGWNVLLQGKKEWKHEQTAEDFTSSRMTHFFQSVIRDCSGSYLAARAAHACLAVLHISPQHQRTAGSNEAIVLWSSTIDEQDREAQQDSSVCG